MAYECDACVVLQEIHYDAPASGCILSAGVDGLPVHPEENESVIQVGEKDPRPETRRLQVQNDQLHACLSIVLLGELHSKHTMIEILARTHA